MFDSRLFVYTDGPTDPIYITDEWPEPGPYLTLENFFAGVEYGIYDPDDGAYYWVSVQDDGHLKETPIKSLREHQPPATICVAFYSK